MSTKFTKENFNNIQKRFADETGLQLNSKHHHKFISAPAKIGLVCACCTIACAGVFATDSGQAIIEKLFFNKPVASEEISYGYKEPSKKTELDINNQSVQGELQGDYSLVTDPGHMGIDIVSEKGTPVYPVLAGVVKETGFEATRGNYIILEHTENYTSTYAHLEKILVDNEQEVTIDTQIGTVGNTGMSTGPHLHLEMTQNGKLIDPTSFLYPDYQDYLIK